HDRLSSSVADEGSLPAGNRGLLQHHGVYPRHTPHSGVPCAGRHGSRVGALRADHQAEEWFYPDSLLAFCAYVHENRRQVETGFLSSLADSERRCALNGPKDRRTRVGKRLPPTFARASLASGFCYGECWYLLLIDRDQVQGRAIVLAAQT